jgi:Tfp pilus assembly PilM family ATPase
LRLLSDSGLKFRRNPEGSIRILSQVPDYFKCVFVPERGLVSVEMAENSIKIAEIIIYQGRREAAKLIKRPLTKDASEEIKKIFDSLNISRRSVMLNIPRHLVTVRFVKLPSTNDVEISKMAKIESLKHVPYADEDIVSGYRIVEKQSDGYAGVLIAVAQAQTVRKEIEILAKAGIGVESVSLGSETLLLWYLAGRETNDKSTILLMNVDAEHIGIDVIANNKLMFTRGIVFSPVRPISTEKIVEQVTLSMSAYRKESAQPVDRIILTGTQVNVGGLKAMLSGNVKVPIEIMDQMKNMPRRRDANLEVEGASFVELLGLAMRHEGADIDLLPEKTRNERRISLMKRHVVISLIVMALIGVMAFGLILKKLHDKRIYIAYIDAELAGIEPQAKKVKEMAKETELITSKIAERPLAIDLVTEIFKTTPSGITLTMMEYENSKAMTLRGAASNLSDVFKYVAILEKSPYLENVKVRYANKRAGQKSETADFEIICAITKAK